jgi:ABC-type transport system substrate-binding protein
MRNRFFVLLAVTVFVASACTGTASSAAPTTAPGESAAPGESTAAESLPLRFSIGGEPTYFSPAYDDDNTGYVVPLIYDAVLSINNKGEVIPALASEMPTASEDGITVTIKLRDDVKWQDGSPFSSADVLFTYNIALSEKCSFYAQVCGQWRDNVEKAEAPDATTVVITLKAPYGPFYILNLQGTPVVPKAATEASYAKFTSATGAVKPGDVKALFDKITAAQGDAACAGDAPPDSCNAETYTAELEAAVTAGGLTLPDKTRYTVVDDSGATVPDPAGYANALFSELSDLNATLSAGEADKLAAAYRLLDINLAPVGTGAFKLASYKPGESVELVRNDDYFAYKVGAPQVLIPIIKDADAAADALVGGNIDVVNTIVSSDALAKLKADPNVTVSEFADLGYYYFAFNVRPGHVFSDRVAQDAVKMCIDPGPTVAAATDNNGIPVKSFVPPGSYYYDPTLPDYKYDPAAAKASLEAAGYTLNANGVYEKAGVALQADLRVRQGRPQRLKYAELARDQLKDCGISLNVLETDFGLLLSEVLAYPNKFDIYLGGYTTIVDPEFSSTYSCDHVVDETRPQDDNATGFCDPKEDELFTKAKQEIDPVKRKAIMTELQTYDLEHGPYYYLWADLGHRGYSNKVTTTGELGPIDLTTFYDTWNIGTWIVQQ